MRSSHRHHFAGSAVAGSAVAGIQDCLGQDTGLAGAVEGSPARLVGHRDLNVGRTGADHKPADPVARKVSYVCSRYEYEWRVRV